MTSRPLTSIRILCAVAVGALLSAGPALADDGAWKASHDTDPHIALTIGQKQALAAKQQAAARNLGAPSGRAGSAPDASVLAALSSSGSLAANQMPQQTGYWCGPASVAEALGQMGVSISQATAAAKLGTTTDGTGWSGGSTSTGHPVPDVLNLYQKRNYFIPQALPYSPGSGDVTNYKSYLLNNITYPKAPIVGDAWEVAGSAYHLVGHPTDRPIFHWFDIRGYTGSGANTMYEDSVHGASSVSWSSSVPAYSTLPSGQIVTILGGRGYVW